MSNFAELLSENVSPEGFHWDKDAITEGGHAISVQSTARLSLCLVHAYTSTHIRKKRRRSKYKKVCNFCTIWFSGSIFHDMKIPKLPTGQKCCLHRFCSIYETGSVAI